MVSTQTTTPTGGESFRESRKKDTNLTNCLCLSPHRTSKHRPTGPPLLIFHGDKDRTVLLDQSLAIVKAYRKIGRPVTLHVLAGSGHGGTAFYTGENRKRLFDFLETSFKAAE
ncbi:MAG: hypothetical protein CMJ45_08750 [Planctomyces sp.]|nr:hypothetical protein [Planctomyces sp.]